MNKNTIFYTLRVNGKATTCYTTITELLEDLIKYLAEHNHSSLEIIRSEGIWELVSKVGAENDYSDEWMKSVLNVAMNLSSIAEKEKLLGVI